MNSLLACLRVGLFFKRLSHPKDIYNVYILFVCFKTGCSLQTQTVHDGTRLKQNASVWIQPMLAMCSIEIYKERNIFEDKQ